MKCTEKQFIELIKKYKGMQGPVADALKVSRQAVSYRIKHNQRILDAYESILEQNIDFAELNLMKKINDGDTTANIFYLKCKAKHRGYVERQEITGADGEAIKTQLVAPERFKEPSEWQKQQKK